MKRWQRVVLISAAVILAVAALIAVIAPPVIRNKLIASAEQATGRKLSIGHISVNPFTFTAGMDRVTLSEKGSGSPFVSFSSARVSLSPRSIYRAAPIVSRVSVVSPRISIVRSGANTYNFSDLLEKKPGEGAKKSEPTRFCINNISVSRGTILFDDRALPSEKLHTISNLTLNVPFVSNMAYVADEYITPHLSAIVNGTPIRFDGKVRKQPTSADVMVSLNMGDLSLPWYMAYLPASVPIAVKSGKLATAGDITYRVTSKTAPQLSFAGTASLTDLAVTERGGGPLLSLRSGSVAAKDAEFLEGRYDVTSVALDGLEVHLSRNDRGEWNFARLRGRTPPEKEKKEKTPIVHLGSAAVKGGKVVFSDASAAGGFSTTIKDMNLDLSGYSSEAGPPARFGLSFESGKGESAKITGSSTSAPLAATASVTIAGIPLAAYYPYLSPYLTRPFSGTASATGEVSYDGQKGFRVGGVKLSFSSLAAIFSAEDHVKIARLSLEGGAFSAAERRLSLERISMKGSDVRVSRDSRGTFSPVALVRKPAAGATPAPAAARAEAAKPFTWSIGTFSSDGMDVRFKDGMMEEPPEFFLKKASISLKNVESSGKKPIPFRISSGYGKNGAFSAGGELVQNPATVRGTFQLKRIGISDFDAYLPADLNITIADGNVDAAGRVNLTRKESGWSGSFGGDLGVRSFYCLDAESDDLLKWESLQFEGVAGTLGPFTLAVGDVVLNHYFAKVIVEKDGRLNLQQLRSPPEGKQGAAPPKPEQAPPAQRAAAPSPAPPAPPSVTVGAVVLQDGLLNFTDNHLNPSYSTTFFNLGGRVSGLTSDANRLADVDLRGNLENQSPLQVTGQINPLRDDLYLDLTLRFNDIEMSPLSPYSSTYLGYLIEKGKLFLDLRYHIERKKLESQNVVFLDQLTLGQKVDSPRATSLPVRLAIALLKDRKGEIHLDLPVSGRTDDPQFSVWGVVLQMLKNMAVKAATAPFSLLQSLFGGGGHDFSSVSFSPGSSALSPAEQEKLLKMAGALRERPVLRIEATGFVDRDRDPEGIRRELLDRKIRTEKFLELVKEKKNGPGDSPDTMKVTPEEYPKYLKAVYLKEKFPKPRTIIGTIRDLPESEMKKLILVNTVVGTKDLQALAAERTAMVRDFLVEKGKLDAGRFFQKNADIFREPKGQGVPGSRVEFGMAVE